MTQIHVSIKKPKTGGLDPVSGTMRFRPVRRHFDASKNLVIAASFDADLSDSGELTVDLLPTSPAFVWQVIELVDTPQAYTRYVEVPDSQTKVEYADLVEVDAATFVPKDVSPVSNVVGMLAASQADAETLSAKYPTRLVFFPEATSVVAASETLARLSAITADAQTQAATVRAMSVQAASDADNMTVLHETAAKSVETITAAESQAKQGAATVTSKATEVSDAAATGITEINQTVETVKQWAEQATVAQPTLTPDSTGATGATPGAGDTVTDTKESA